MIQLIQAHIARRQESLIRQRRHEHISVDQANLSPFIQAPSHKFQGVRTMPIISVRIGQITAAGEPNSPIPGSIKRFPLSANVDDVRILSLKFLNNRTFILRRSAINYEHLDCVFDEESLVNQIFQTSEHEELRFVGRDQRRNDEVIRRICRRLN